MSQPQHPYEVAVYYFPQWHPDAKNEANKGEGWTEWPTLRAAKPLFPGHEQPKAPLWGELDESDPEVSAKQIDAAADHGVTSFIYDWYWDMGGDGPFLHRALEDGFLQAPNRDRLRFGIMWANHNEVSRERFDAMTDYLIIRYFQEPNFLKLDGKLYFSIYECHTLIKGLGSIEATRDALESFRVKTREAGCGELHLNLVEWGLNERHRDIIGDPAELVRTLGIDSVTSYVWVHHAEPEAFPDAPYADCAREAAGMWPQFRDAYGVPYYPNATMGWDPGPRCDQDQPHVKGEYPYMSILTGNTPEAFETMLDELKTYLDDQSGLATRMFTIYAWNEWTEGGYLEPDTVHGMKYLEAIRNVFGS